MTDLDLADFAAAVAARATRLRRSVFLMRGTCTAIGIRWPRRVNQA
ncbi:hypothetical protein [Micromonospora sp. NPDC005806]